MSAGSEGNRKRANVGLVDRADRWQRRHASVGFPVAVVYKFFDDQGSYLAALITYYGFLSLFPLLLLLTSVLGFVLEGHRALQHDILTSAVSQFPVIGDQLRDPVGLRGSGVALAFGGAVALYGALGVAQAMQNAMNVVWGVPRNRRPNPIRARLRSLLLIATVGSAVIVTTGLSSLGRSSDSLGLDLPWASAASGTAAAFVLSFAVFVATFRIGTAHPAGIGQTWPGAALASAIWQGLQFVGSTYVAHVVRGAPSAYGVFAIVLGLLAWIHLAALGLVLGLEVNVVRAKRLSPRALLTPFTDEVNLTSGDRSVYTDAAVAQQFKRSEEIDVEFVDRPRR